MIAIIILEEPNRLERIAYSSFKGAIRIIKAKNGPETTAKIENRAGEILFTSVDTAIEDWENEWERTKRRLAEAVEDAGLTIGSHPTGFAAGCLYMPGREQEQRVTQGDASSPRSSPNDCPVTSGHDRGAS